MKNIIFIFMLSALLLNPVPVYADESGKTFHFELDGGDWNHDTIAPGEYLEDEVVVRNETGYPLEFRLIRTENLDDSGLYGVMKYSMGGSDFVDLADMASGWIPVGINETVKLPVIGYMPEGLGNEWQGKELDAMFYFEGRLLEESDIPEEPEEPTEPDKPIDPIDPTPPDNPEEPTEPDKPNEPDKPIDPIDPTPPDNPVIPIDPTPPDSIGTTDISGIPSNHYKSLDPDTERVTVTVEKSGKGVVIKAAKTGDTTEVFWIYITLATSLGVSVFYIRRWRNERENETDMETHI